MDGVGEVASLLEDYDQVLEAWSDPDADFEKLGSLQAEIEGKIEAAGAWDLQRMVEIAMDALRLPAGDSSVENLSGGETRRVALCKLLLSKPDLLLLDEPTNHLDAESVAWLERFLSDYVGTVVAITHDRYFLDNVAEWILELDRGRGIPYQGNYSSWLEQKEKRLSDEKNKDAARQRTLARELDWVRMAPKARQAKGKLGWRPTINFSQKQSPAIALKENSKLISPLIKDLATWLLRLMGFRRVSVKTLIEDLSFSLPKAGIVGIVGANGAGKSTLFNLLTGTEPVDSGKITIGPTVDLGYVDQSRESLDPSRSVYEEITGGVDNLIIGGKK